MPYDTPQNRAVANKLNSNTHKFLNHIREQIMSPFISEPPMGGSKHDPVVDDVENYEVIEVKPKVKRTIKKTIKKGGNNSRQIGGRKQTKKRK